MSHTISHITGGAFALPSLEMEYVYVSPTMTRSITATLLMWSNMCARSLWTPRLRSISKKR